MGKNDIVYCILLLLYSQVMKLLDKAKIIQISREHGGERYIKRFDAWTHLVVMLLLLSDKTKNSNKYFGCKNNKNAPPCKKNCAPPKKIFLEE
jgi:hypothetical protein